MTATIQLDPAAAKEIIAAATAEATARILYESLLTRDEAAGVLRVTTKTLNLLPIQRVKLGGATRYRRADIHAFIASSLEK